MTSTTENKPAVIQSLQVGLTILELLAIEKEPLKFSEIQQLTSMTKSNLYKYLTTLAQFGLIHRNPETNAYTLGYKLIQLGNIALGKSSLVEMVIPYLKKINEATNLTALLAVPSDNGPLVSYISSAYFGINIGAQIGTHLPHYSSTGVSFLAFKKSTQMTTWEQDILSNLSNEELQVLQANLEETRKLSFATKIEPLIQHISSFSVPLLNYDQELLGTITLVGYTETVPKKKEHPTSQYVIDIAREISTYYGYSK